MQETWVNTRLSEEPYNIGDFLKPGDTVAGKVRSAQGFTYFIETVGKERQMLKVYNCALTEELDTALKTVQSMRHPAICEISEFGEKSGHAYEKRPYYEQVTFTESPASFATAVLNLTDAINELHYKQLEALDIKPENIVVTVNGAVIVDIGSFSVIKRGSKEGYTPSYCAPEIDDGNYCWANDFFSLGITLFELITWKNPFKDLVGDDLHKAKTNPQWWLPTEAAQSNLGQLLRGLIDPDPQKRWGYNEVISWHREIDINTLAREVMELHTMFRSGLVYNETKVKKAAELTRRVTKAWDVGYFFDMASSLSFVDPLLAIKAALIRSEFIGEFTQNAKMAGTISLYCFFNKEAKAIYLNGQEYESVFKLGQYIYDKTVDLYDNLWLKQNSFELLMKDGEFGVFWAAAQHGVFQQYIKSRAREQDADMRADIADPNKRRLNLCGDFYNAIYNMTLIAYALIDKNVLVAKSATGNKTPITSHSTLAQLISNGLESEESAEATISPLLYPYTELDSDENTRSNYKISQKYKISPVVKAWSDYTNKLKEVI